MAKMGWIVWPWWGAFGAMAFNRLIDAVSMRAIRARACATCPRVLSRGFTWASWRWRRWCLCLRRRTESALLRLARGARHCVFLLFTKRFTRSHTCAGIRAGRGAGGRLDRHPRRARSTHPWLTAAVTFWTAGFDVIYACQDYEFDSVEGLFSLPRIWALRARCAWRVCSRADVACLLALVYSLRWRPERGGVAAVTGLLIYEHSLVKATDLSRVDAAFFTMNAMSACYSLYSGLPMFYGNRN